MQRILIIALIILSHNLAASEAAISTIIWYNGDSFYKFHSKKNATVFFSRWSPEAAAYFNDNSIRVALQLDCKFDPIPNDSEGLPNLKALSAIDDEALVIEYLKFLENYSRSAGLDYLVVSKSIAENENEKKIISKALELSPYFFISRDRISEPNLEQQSHFKFSEPPILIVDQAQNVSKVRKWIRKNSIHKAEFYINLENSSRADFVETSRLSEELRNDIFQGGVTLVDKSNVLPIQADTIVYVGTDEKLRYWLSKHAKLSLDETQGYQRIVDQRTKEYDTSPGDIIIQTFDADINTNTSTLITPVEFDQSPVLLSNMLFGAHPINGNLPLSRKTNGGFLGHYPLEWNTVDPNYFNQIDSVAALSINGLATPGCQIVAVKNEAIIFNKSYGFYTYDSLQRIAEHTLYDLASLTKVVATLPAIALLLDQGKINLDDSISQYLSVFEKSNKSGITIRKLLAHNGGIPSYIPFWSYAMDGDRLDAFYYKDERAEKLDIRTYGFEPHPALKDTILNWIVDSKLIREPEQMNYSDIGFMILHMLVENVTGKSFDSFLDENFYQPMGLNIGFNPTKNGVKYDEIAPTEFDERYRNDQVWGEVHDRNAHVFGGVAGHAGLFGNAEDIGKMIYMMMNNGRYGGRQYLSRGVLEQLNARYFENNRRGLGWDKKGEKASASSFASDLSFGHTGFTGTMVWADPEEKFVYVFLSNRIYPDANNYRLLNLNTRTAIHDIFYQSFSDNPTD